MKIVYKLVTIVLLLVLALLPTRAAHARGLSDGKVIFGQNFTLAKGETLDGDLIVFGGNVTIEDDAKINGSLAVFGGNASVGDKAVIASDVAMFGGNMQMNGTIDGDMVMLGGQASLGSNSLVSGDLSTFGGQVQRAAGSQVMGQVVNNAPVPSLDILNKPNAVTPPNIPQPRFNFNFDPVWGVINIFFRAIGLALVAMLAVLFLHPQMERVSQAIASQPVIAGSFGLLTIVVGTIALLIIGLTIILLPVSFLGALALVLGWMFGVIAIGHEVGERFTHAINQSWAPVLTAGFGTFLLVLVVEVVGLIPCIGWLAPFLVGLMGLGGVALTYFGSRNYPHMMAPSVEAPPPAS